MSPSRFTTSRREGGFCFRFRARFRAPARFRLLACPARFRARFRLRMNFNAPILAFRRGSESSQATNARRPPAASL